MDIVNDFPGTVFSTAEIEQRTIILSKMIDKHTKYWK
jgi:hypothetical protein